MHASRFHRIRTRNSPSFARAWLIWFALISLAACGHLASIATAQTEEISVGNHSGVAARAVGMGGAFTGVADSVAAIHWNPAGLIQMKHMEIGGTLSHIDRKSDALLFGGNSNEVHRTDVRLNMLGAAFPLYSTGPRMVLGLGVTRVQNLDARADVLGQLGTDAPVLAELRIDERTEDSGGIFSWSAALAGLLSQHVAVGGALDLWTGSYEQELLSDIRDPNDAYEISSQRFEDTVERSYLGFGVRLGSMVRVHPYLQVGAQLRFPMSLEIDEYWTQDTFERDDDGTVFEDFDDGSLLYDLRLPMQAALGVSVGDRRARIAADVEYANWTSTEYSTPPEPGISNRDFEDFYRNVVQWRVGGEYLIEPLQTKVRAGFWSHPLAFEGKEIVDDRRFFSLGLGTLVDEVLELNLSYVRGSWRQDSDVLAQKVVTHQVFLAASYRAE